MYEVLYRKNRPKAFNFIKGQPHIVKTLENQVKSGQLSHAYLFVGTRGTGKTSAAKILARAVNCENPQNGSPCNICNICTYILNDECLDVIEIDAASNNGVDNIRDLREEVQYMPTMGRFKVYIIDEVHMLSTSAYNALLKTLEEPPGHIIFILATTDPQKIPATILSRCQRFDFKRIEANVITNALSDILTSMDKKFEKNALEYIALHSDGSMRDALSLLDQCIGDDILTESNVRDMLGSVDQDFLIDFTNALLSYDSKRAFELIDDAMSKGRDVVQMTNDLIKYFRDCIVYNIIANNERLREYIYTFSDMLNKIRFVAHNRIIFEITALKLCQPMLNQDLSSINNRLSAIEHILQQTPPQPQPVVQPVTIEKAKEPPILYNSNIPYERIEHDWNTIVNSFPNPLRASLSTSSFTTKGGVLYILCTNETRCNAVNRKKTEIEEKIKNMYNLQESPNITIEVAKERKKDDWASHGFIAD